MKPKLFLNWKMYSVSPVEADALTQVVQKNTPADSAQQVVIFPPFIYLERLQTLLNQIPAVGLGAQDVSSFVAGAYTGEISATFLNQYHVQYCLVGHSETRSHHSLSNRDTNRKIVRCLEQGITPILCIGYEENPQGEGINYSELHCQIAEGLQGLDSVTSHTIFIAYEPVWAIGSGKAATPDIVTHVLQNLRQFVTEHPELKKLKVEFIYGGSVSETNLQEYLNIPEISGFLIGSASVVPEKVAQLIEIIHS
jgi:triosephosphate isomerase